MFDGLETMTVFCWNTLDDAAYLFNVVPLSYISCL